MSRSNKNYKPKRSKLEKRIGYSFKDPTILEEALTHSSYMHDRKISYCNERFEFLGDALLSIITAEYLFKQYPHMNEGDLTRKRASLVCEEALCDFAKSISLGDYIQLSNGESTTGGRERPSILADAFEALITAIYIDSGMEETKRFVLTFIESDSNGDSVTIDYKSKLQMYMQRDDISIEYIVTDETGPDHKKEFTVEVLLDGKLGGSGKGSTKKSAEQKAAQNALEKTL